MIEGAVKLKGKIKASQKSSTFTPVKSHTPFHHPFAKSLKEGQIVLSTEETALLKACRDSARIIIHQEDYQILKNYFEKRKKENDKLGNLYKTFSFSDFILRLVNKRFKVVYFDGRNVVLRNDEFKGGKDGKNFLQSIGSNADEANLYKEYLALEEAVLSPLVLLQATSIIIGTGSRTEEIYWNIKKEYDESIDIATVSYPAAVEFRNGNTAHYDLYFIARSERDIYTKEVDAIKKNPALVNAARKIYGENLAFEKDKNDKDFVTLVVTDNRFYILKRAYINKTKIILRNALQAADAQMRQDHLGKTFQLKGLGLGAFAFSGKENGQILQKLFIDALKELLMDNTFSLSHINCINLINLPTDFDDQSMKDGTIIEEGLMNGIKILRSVMDPTSAKNKKSVGEIGGMVVCGDSGSKFGNEGNEGLDRSSSDDPASQYSLLDPLILDPEANLKLQDKKGISILNKGSFEPYIEKLLIMDNSKKPDTKENSKKDIARKITIIKKNKNGKILVLITSIILGIIVYLSGFGNLITFAAFSLSAFVFLILQHGKNMGADKPKQPIASEEYIKPAPITDLPQENTLLFTNANTIKTNDSSIPPGNDSKRRKSNRRF